MFIKVGSNERAQAADDFHEQIKDVQREVARKTPLAPCRECKSPRPYGERLDIQMTPFKAMFVVQAIDGGLCVSCAIRHVETKGYAERAERQSRPLRPPLVVL